MKEPRVYLDVSALPTHSFGSRDLLWWGTIGFMVIEGSMFAMLLVTLGYLRGMQAEWPPPAFAPPDLLWGTLNGAVMLVSLWPNAVLRKAAEALDRERVEHWMHAMDAIGLVLLAVRALELSTLNVRWDSNAYGSIVWLVLGFHTLHLLTEVGESFVLSVFVHRRPTARRFKDVSESCMYWNFVVIAWLPIYLALYGVPRWT